jgi:hypothetical protein
MITGVVEHHDVMYQKLCRKTTMSFLLIYIGYVECVHNMTIAFNAETFILELVADTRLDGRPRQAS